MIVSALVGLGKAFGSSRKELRWLCIELGENERSHNQPSGKSQTGPSWGELGLVEHELGPRPSSASAWPSSPRPGSVRSVAFAYFASLTNPLFLARLRHFVSQFGLYGGVISSSTCLMMEPLYLMVALLLVELEKVFGCSRTELK